MDDFDINGEIPIKYASELEPQTTAEEFVQRLAEAAAPTLPEGFKDLPLDERLSMSTVLLQGNIVNFLLKAAAGFALECLPPGEEGSKLILDVIVSVYRGMADYKILTKDEAMDQIMPRNSETGLPLNPDDYRLDPDAAA